MIIATARNKRSAMGDKRKFRQCKAARALAAFFGKLLQTSKRCCSQYQQNQKVFYSCRLSVIGAVALAAVPPELFFVA